MEEIIKEILEQRCEIVGDAFDDGWNAGLSCAIGIIEHHLNSSAHKNAHGK